MICCVFLKRSVLTSHCCLFDCLSTGNNEENCVEVRSIFPLTDIKEEPLLVFLFIAGCIVVSCAFALTNIAYETYRNHKIPRPVTSMTDRDMKYSLEAMGEKSVYRFFLGRSVFGWLIVTATLAAQIWLLSVFVDASKRDPSDPKVDMIYTWKCNRDEEKCFDTRKLDCKSFIMCTVKSKIILFLILCSSYWFEFLPGDWKGWLAFAILMLLHLLKDAINGIKMIKYSAKGRHSRFGRVRLFIGGTILMLITMFTTYVSILYNNEVSTSKFFL